MASLNVVIIILTLLLVAIVANAETHTISMVNNCGHGLPILISEGKVVSTGSDYTAAKAISGISYLQTGQCLYNGEHCALLEYTLVNPHCPGCGSSSDISLIPDHEMNLAGVKFEYFNGCDNTGARCDSPSCSSAFRVPDDTHVQVHCQENDVNLRITYCPGAERQHPRDFVM